MDIVRDLMRAVRQLSDPAFGRVLVLSLLGALGLLALLWAAVFVVLSNVTIADAGFLGAVAGIDLIAAADWMAGGALVAGLFFASWAVYPAAATLITGIFLDDIVGAVERAHYPHLPPPRRIPAWDMTMEALKFTCTAIVLNIVILPTLFIGIYPIPFFVLNAWLIGREYFEMVTIRYLAAPGSRSTDARRRPRLGVFLAGCVIMTMSMIPLVNLIAPIVGTAFMVHVAMRRKAFATLSRPGYPAHSEI